jgi:hypothetical protein
MSNLLNTAEGRNVVLEAQRYLLKRRLSRFFKRNLVIDFEQFSKGLGEFDLGTLLGQLNPAWDDELIDLYRLLGTIGALPESIADTQIYVNPTTGSDITGTGSTDRPYASLWFLGFLPKRINHLYRVLIYGDIDHGGPLTLTNEIGDGGSLSFVGVGPAVEVFSAVASFVDAAPVNQQQTWIEIETNTPPVAGVTRSYIQFLDGANVSYAAPVNRIDIGNQRVYFRRDPLSGIVQNNNFHYIEPAHTLTVQGLNIVCSGSHRVPESLSFRGSRVNFVNLTIAVDNQGSNVNTMVYTDGVPMTFSFCQIEVAGEASAYPCKIQNSINEFVPVDDQLIALSACGVGNLFQGAGGQPISCGMQFINPDAAEYDYADRVLLIGNGSYAQSIDCMGYVRALGSSTVRRLSAKQLQFWNATSDADYICGDPNNATPNAISVEHSLVRVGHALVGLANTGFLLANSRVYFSQGGGSVGATMTVLGAYAFDLSGQSKLYLRNPWTGQSGTINDIVFSDPSPVVAAAFPAANAIVSGGNGSDCSRYN